MPANKCLLTLLLLTSSQLLAQDWFDNPKPKEDDKVEDKGLITYAPSVRVMVPIDSGFRGKTLRVDGIAYPLKEYVDLPGLYQEEEVEVEIIDSDGRIVDYQYRTISDDMLRDFKERHIQFRLGGGYRKTDDDKWDPLGIRPSGPTIDFAVHYFSNKWGLRIGLQRIKRSGKDASGQLTEYEVTETPILVGYDFVPLPDSLNWRQWQLRFWVGAVLGKHNLKLHYDRISSDPEGNSTVIDAGKLYSAKTTGIHLGVESMRPITDRVWFTTEYALIHRSLKFAEANFVTEKPIHDFKLGIYFSL